MRAFARLYGALDETTKTTGKVDALVQYFKNAPPEDAVWTIHFLIGRRIKRLIETRKLVEWAIAEAGIPEWIFGDCYSAVGDLAETTNGLLANDVKPAVGNLNKAIAAAQKSMETLDSTLGDARPVLQAFSKQTVPEVGQLVHDLREMAQALSSVAEKVDRGGVSAIAGRPRLPDYKPAK